MNHNFAVLPCNTRYSRCGLLKRNCFAAVFEKYFEFQVKHKSLSTNRRSWKLRWMIIVTLGKNQMDDHRYSKESEEQRLEALAAAGRYVGFCVFPCVQCRSVPPNQFSQSQLLTNMTADFTIAEVPCITTKYLLMRSLKRVRPIARWKQTFFIYLSTVTNLSNKTNAQERYKISLTPLSRSLYQLYCESRRRKMQFLPILS